MNKTLSYCYCVYKPRFHGTAESAWLLCKAAGLRISKSLLYRFHNASRRNGVRRSLEVVSPATLGRVKRPVSPHTGRYFFQGVMSC